MKKFGARDREVVIDDKKIIIHLYVAFGQMGIMKKKQKDLV